MTVKSEYLIKKGPYCYDCGEYLGPEYSDGEQCTECWAKAHGFDEDADADEKGQK